MYNKDRGRKKKDNITKKKTGTPIDSSIDPAKSPSSQQQIHPALQHLHNQADSWIEAVR